MALLAAASLSCQTDDSANGDEAVWTGHLQNAERARKAKQFERAEIELRAALRLLGESPSERRAHTRVLASLARLKGEKQEIAAAGSLFQASIDIQLSGTEWMVSDHLVNDIGQLAMVRNRQKNQAAAESLLTHILTLREQGIVSLDPIEPTYSQILGMMADLANERGFNQRADSLRARAQTYEQYWRGFDAKVREQYPKAQEHFLKALSSGEEALGVTHPDIARFCRDLSMAYAMQAKHDQAAAMLTRAVDILDQHGEPVGLAVALGELAEALDRLDRTAEAEATRKRLAAVHERDEAPR